MSEQDRKLSTIRVWAASDRIAGPENAARRTVAGLVASALAVLPLREIFTDWAWLPNVWVAMLLAIGPAALLRTRQPARIIHLLPGLVLTICYLTVRFVPDHAWGGIVPLAGAWKDVAVLNGDFHTTVRDGSAPLHSTEAVRMVLAALVVLLAVAVDLVAVVARRPALAGVAFLALFSVAGTVPRQAVGWLWFVLAALGYLLLLSSDTRDEVSRWGRLMPRPAGASRAAVKALTGRRIALIALVIALAVPLLLPIPKHNLLADAFHGGSGRGGGEGGVSLDPFVRLKGQLNRKDPVDLMDVAAVDLGDHRPLYLSEYVLDTYDASGWHRGPRGVTEPLQTTSFGAAPESLPDDKATFSYSATITIKNLDDVAAPVFQSPTGIEGLSESWAWSKQDAAVLGGRIRKGESYTESVQQPQPSIAALQQSTSVAKVAAVQPWLQHPVMPNEVGRQVQTVIRGVTSPYARTLAILKYFGPDNDFTYSLATKTGDSGSALVDFLRNRTGFCQQYAAAMAIMLRLAGVPSRVVVGYTHPAPDKDGKFTVTTNDAHAWVEAYFAGAGWLPFDPTPLSGPDALRAARMSWAPQPQLAVPSAPAAGSGSGSLSGASGRRTTIDSDGGAAPQASGSGGPPAWVGWLFVGIAGLILLLVLVPGGTRLWRRRARLHAAARGPDPLWQELADTAVDLGYVWSPVRSPRQVVIWLRREGVSGDADDSLRTLATAVELSRYSSEHGGVATRELVTDLRRVEVSLRGTRSGWERVRARLLPESLGWRRRRRRH
jgi:transglutaminase-like putative cysteine protease